MSVFVYYLYTFERQSFCWNTNDLKYHIEGIFNFDIYTRKKAQLSIK